MRNKLVMPCQIVLVDLTQGSTANPNIQSGKLLMLRKDLIELLRNGSMDLVEIASHLEVSQKDVEDDLRHLIKSLKHADYRLVVTPAYCRKCDFTFNRDKLHKPGKCPQCYGTWIQGPLFDIEQKT